MALGTFRTLVDNARNYRVLTLFTEFANCSASGSGMTHALRRLVIVQRIDASVRTT
jgi:hypothetical protein